MVRFSLNEGNIFTKLILGLPRDKRQLFLYQFGVYSIILGSLVLFLSLTDGDLEVVADQIMFVRRGKIVLRGEIPFITAISGQSAPLSYYLWVVPILISDISGLSYSVSFRLFFIAANILTSFLIYSIVESLTQSQQEDQLKDDVSLASANSGSVSALTIPAQLSPFLSALIYSLNPFSIDLAIFWGSDETIAALLILLPCWLLRKRLPFLAAVVIALGAGIKYFPVVLCAIFMFNDRPRNFFSRVLLSLFAFGSVIIAYFPFYFWGDTDRLVSQFNRSTIEGGNQGVLTMLAKMEWFDMDQLPTIVRWGTILLLCTVIGLLMLKKEINDPYLSAGPFLIIALITYSKYQFSYLLMINVFIVPFFLLSWKNVVAYFSVFLTMGLFSYVFVVCYNELLLLLISVIHALSLLYWVVYLIHYGEAQAKKRLTQQLKITSTKE
ncbi:MAG: glycosyltransferase 87 family protein [Candidatus Kariarchaeaceae archaeon]